jgi:superfamily II DNA or RNA helicase
MRALPPGLYEHLINEAIRDAMQGLSGTGASITTDSLERYGPDIPDLLASYLHPVVRKAFSFLQDGHLSVPEQIERCNRVIDLLSSVTGEPCLERCRLAGDQVLLSVEAQDTPSSRPLSSRPSTLLSQNALFTGSPSEPSLVHELKAEILSADRIDLLVSFIKWSGIRLLMDELQTFTATRPLRIITTSYVGATDLKAVEFLSSLPNTEIRISYDTERTRLHAKAYAFHRQSGFSTVYIGSSNLSNPAITSGLEWNVKLSERNERDLVDQIRMTFETYWAAPDFSLYTPSDVDRLRDALRSQGRAPREPGTYFDIRPFYYQQDVLDRLKAEREVHGRYRNLVVAATGTGKTVIAAFDFRDHLARHPHARLLYVAHREEILEQSLACFQGVLRDYNFGELCSRGQLPSRRDHVFMTIQTFNSQHFSAQTSPDHFDYIVVDEVHHAPAASYRHLLAHYTPTILLGLTATPERADGEDLLGDFDGHVAAELRLPEAIDRGLLAPFHYFGVTDPVNLDADALTWRQGYYDEGQLSKLYTGNYERVRAVLTAIERFAPPIDEIIGLGFCVSVEHATFMAQMFDEAGISSIAVSAETPRAEREKVRGRLRRREVHFVFTVDLFNEGIDIPEINTALFLRPTKSLTVFLQQLGRGLRLWPGKENLTVLDFVGRQHERYRFEPKYRALAADVSTPIGRQIERDALILPRGCYVSLERVARETVLAQIRRSFSRQSELIQAIHDLAEGLGGQCSLRDALEHLQRSPDEIYRHSTFRTLCARAGLCDSPSDEDEAFLLGASRRLLHIDSQSFIAYARTFLASRDSALSDADPMANLLYYTLYNDPVPEESDATVASRFYRIFEREWMVEEMDQLLGYLQDRIGFSEAPLDLGFPTAVQLHCTYTRAQIFAGLGLSTPRRRNSRGSREGVLYLPEMNLDVFFVTLNKSEEHFSPSTLYKDYAIDDRHFHWQSQSTTSASSPTGRRYIEHEQRGGQVLLFVREFKTINGVTQPFTCLGTASYDHHTGSKPMSIVWRLHAPIPARLMNKANKVVGG